MERIKPGDTVVRKSYEADIFFIVLRISQGRSREPMATLKGLNIRLIADAPLSDLVKVGPHEIEKAKQDTIAVSQEAARKVVLRRISEENMRRQRLRASGGETLNFLELPGKVLHLDGDQDYLKECLDYYRQLKVPCVGAHVPEEEQPERVVELIEMHSPDILVLTGHDGLMRRRGSKTTLSNYRSSRYFAGAVRRARQKVTNKDSLVIVAGACQSHFEVLIEAGANFASSPERVFIHCYDPILVAERIAFTPIDTVARASDVVESTITGLKGIGGVETRGQFRLGVPKIAEISEESWT